MPDMNTVRAWEGRTMVDRDGSPVGSINAIFLDDQTGRPEWALVNTGLFGTRSSFVPLAQAAWSGENVQVRYDKRLIKDAPRVDVDQHLSEAEERQLWRHYGLEYDTTDPSVATGRDATGRGTAGRDVSGPTDDAVTRSEEELRVGTAQRERGRVRLRKYVTTEKVQQAVPVQRERVRLEREPITDADIAATSGPDISEEEQEVVLREEEPVVEKRVVPRERVRLDTETVTDERQVTEELRKERIDVHDENTRGARHERRRR